MTWIEFTEHAQALWLTWGWASVPTAFATALLTIVYLRHLLVTTQCRLAQAEAESSERHGQLLRELKERDLVSTPEFMNAFKDVIEANFASPAESEKEDAAGPGVAIELLRVIGRLDTLCKSVESWELVMNAMNRRLELLALHGADPADQPFLNALIASDHTRAPGGELRTYGDALNLLVDLLRNNDSGWTEAHGRASVALQRLLKKHKFDQQDVDCDLQPAADVAKASPRAPITGDQVLRGFRQVNINTTTT